jgi:N6-adenosine-specific RNA methylase IME4
MEYSNKFLAMLNLNKKYNIIYADPPWNHVTWSKKGRGRNPDTLGHYPVMDFEEIKKLPVPDIADKNCVLFLWVLDQMLPQSLDLIKHWGFTYSTVGFNWVKTNKNNSNYFIGMGWWTRANQELCLLAKKGTIKRKSKSVRRLIVSPRQQHSKKPDEIRDRIVELCGDLPRIELFARQKTPGWDVWGNEV